MLEFLIKYLFIFVVVAVIVYTIAAFITFNPAFVMSLQGVEIRFVLVVIAILSFIILKSID